MRVNVYAEEVTHEVKLVTTKSDTGAVFYGIRFFLESADKLHHTPEDDDRSAVTFWIRSHKTGFQLGDERSLLHAFDNACDVLEGLPGRK